MYVDPNENFARAMALWDGQPSRGLMWTFYFNQSLSRRWAEEAGYAEPFDFFMKDLGSLNYAHLIHPLAVADPVEVVESREGDIVGREYRSPFGTLTEVRKGPRILQHRVRSEADLRVLVEVWKGREIRLVPENFDQPKQAGRGRWPVVIASGPSAVQHVIQVEMSVEDFWYAIADSPALMEEAMDVWQANKQREYDILMSLPADAFYQDENTSTTLISPEYYRRYSLGHIRQFVGAAHDAGKRAVVHMCGHLRDLVPLFREADMDGIDCLTPPPVGNTEFRYAYGLMPGRFFCTGRFGTSLWYRKGREEILANLAAALPHDIYRDRAFVLAVTGDGITDISPDNIRLLADCINEYDRTVN